MKLFDNKLISLVLNFVANKSNVCNECGEYGDVEYSPCLTEKGEIWLDLCSTCRQRRQNR